ncbi:putative M18 family aminopeptidase 1 [[Clostridium] cellulosi]|jgi:Aminopeptidase I zinc metalloprotease (M18).|uniref:M18 family aminopeptidase n=1 Tax=[Clostridium] cellulosi TaxID=29343 RepID=A0A078KM38_9FIRM|nr:MAG: aminopeptidase [[Clostridium] cellulosi]CDZ23582.1 putative M18 family aminopeptidase 1 [[Clostridium] cellulosi]
MEEKSKAKALKEKLLMNPKNGGIVMSDEEIKTAFNYCNGYKAFLDAAKTEREAVTYAINEAQKLGFVPFDKKQKYKKGDKVYYNNRGKSIILAVIGSKPLDEGVHLTAAHIDSPRLDLKQRPLYEESQLGLFKTHYYGGIKKYQWPTIPLALHGVIVKKDGTQITVRLGEDENDPQFCVTDLLPHLDKDMGKKTMDKAFNGEQLNVLIGSLPFRDDKESELVKLNIIKLLNEKYDIVEADFLSAELTMVPAFKAVDIGFDRSMIGAYGHDDRVCAYPALTALFKCGVPETTCVCCLTDKEEIGSEGNTGLISSYLKNFIADLARPYGLEARDVLSNSKCLSADVTAAFDPTYPDAMEKNNAAFLNYGVGVNKFTGHGGKYSTSDASAEFTSWVRQLLDSKGIMWQMAELGKVDQGGGGTVAKYIAELDVDVIDVGVPVLSMHSPFEVVSKLDVYSAYRAFYEFYKA